MSNQAKIIVRTWGHNRKGVYHLLKTVNYPLEVIQQIQQWAVEHQVNLLHQKYCERSNDAVIPSGKSKDMPHTQAASDASNKLWRELQRQGFNTEDDRHAITFLFEIHQDNPELINLNVTQEFFESIASADSLKVD